ncbi:MAG: helicase, partial [Acidimicrobiia bacterium]
MRDIVATVQREQDEVIRAPLPGVLVVQGGPGTGKTAVALHRAAYLLYTHRFPLERQGVLVVAPNRLFMKYISLVLPSLGESGVELATVAGLVAAVVPGVAPTLDEPPAVARLKGDARMAAVLARAVRDRERPLRSTVEVGFGPYVLRITPAVSAEIVRIARRRGGQHNPRRALVERLL